jgi:hypothetical protein
MSTKLFDLLLLIIQSLFVSCSERPFFVESPTGTVKKVFENRLVTLNEIRDEDAMLLELADPNKTFYIYENNVGLMAHQDIASDLSLWAGKYI